ncbi:MAG: ribosome maturation factor RimP [Acidobacteriota bacterium]|nr:ribosome maturation factor RimP [Acidobacteriota bacterium]
MKRDDVVSKIEQIAEEVAASKGLEIFAVELKGSGRNQLLRIYIDKAEGVTHTDCEFISRAVGDRLDEDDSLPGPYQLEVSSPGVERELKKWQHWERFRGQKARVVLTEPAAGDLKHFDGVISEASANEQGARTVTIELAGGRQVTFPFEQVERANLKFEW